MKNSLAEKRPDLLSEWSMRNDLSPTEITYGSNKRVWWVGKCGHEWQASVKDRTSHDRTGCPYCAGKLVLHGYNDLASRCSDLAEEWSDRNLFSACDVTYGSNKLVWWHGKCGHEWQATVKSRATGIHTGCPYCSGNRVLAGFNDLETRFPEVAREWSERNLPLLPSQVTAYCNKKAWWSGSCGHTWEARISDRSAGHGCPYCTDHKLLPGFNDFASCHPDLAREWSDQNLPVTPDSIAEKKEGVFWWRCPDCGGEYQAWLYNRIMGSKCPYCSNRKVQQGNNDLATTDPLIAAEWVKVLNAGIKPTKVTRTSHKAYWWKGSCGHTYKAKISDRAIHHVPCPVCESELYVALPTLLVMLYAKRCDTPLRLNSSKLIGIPLEMYLPEQKVVIEQEAPTLFQFKEQLVKKQLLAKRGIRFLTMVRHEMPLDMASEAQRTLSKCDLFIRSDIHDDVRFVAQQYLRDKCRRQP